MYNLINNIINKENMKKLFFIMLSIITPLFASNQFDVSTKKEKKDSIFYKATEDMLQVESLLVLLPLIGYDSTVAKPVTIAGIGSLGLLKAINQINNPQDQPISTETGLLTATIPVSICTIGLKAALDHTFKNNNDELLHAKISTAACTTIYAAFVATASLKK